LRGQIFGGVVSEEEKQEVFWVRPVGYKVKGKFANQRYSISKKAPSDSILKGFGYFKVARVPGPEGIEGGARPSGGVPAGDGGAIYGRDAGRVHGSVLDGRGVARGAVLAAAAKRVELLKDAESSEPTFSYHATGMLDGFDLAVKLLTGIEYEQKKREVL
jgi:hypothetical protein